MALLAVVALVVPLATVGAQQSDAPTVTLVDYRKAATGEARPAVTYWKWTPEQKAKAVQFSSLKIVADPETKNNAMKLRITGELPFGRRNIYRAALLKTSYLPPTVDALRLRVKPLSGTVILSLGGPTIYFGHSDVYTRPVEIRADGKGWRDVLIPLNHSLVRNYRRAGFGRHSPVIYYTRWVQEPVALAVWKGSDGEMLIERIEGVSLSKGRPFPVFPAAQVKRIASAANLKNPKTPFAFNFAHAPMLSEVPEKVTPISAYRARVIAGGKPITWHVPPKWTLKDGVLEVSQTAAEEVSLMGLKLDGTQAKQANAIRISIQADNSEPRPTPLVLDFLLLATAEGTPFPWSRFELPEKIRQHHPALNFDYILSKKRGRGVGIAMFHARRPLKRGQPTELIIPLAEFVCFSGDGAMKQTLLEQKMPLPTTLRALGIVSPFQHRKGKTTLRIRAVDFVSVPVDRPGDLRSYDQIPDPSKIKIVPFKGRFVQEIGK